MVMSWVERVATRVKPRGNGQPRRPAPEHADIEWWHSIDLGGGEVTKGKKPIAELAADFARLGLDAETLCARSVLDVGCSDGYMSLACEALGAEVTAIDGIAREGLQYVRRRLEPKFKFYAIDVLSHSFNELGRFDVVLYFGVLYHTMYPFEQLVRIASACKDGGRLFLESAYYNLSGFESDATMFFNFDGKIAPDLSSPVFPSIVWIESALRRIGFREITMLHTTGGNGPGRVTFRAEYGGLPNPPLLYAAEQALP
jgi:2-polyprenyl-3-methyl-5-hydroxy-6-metoxy-1,4-benzoquinol methylase